MIGVNVDPSYPEASPDPARLKDLGLRWIRIVSRDMPQIHAYVDRCNSLDLAILSAIALESNGYIMPGATVHQIGNEPDIKSESSWTRTPAEYVQDWNIYRDTYPDITMITAGLASGSTGWLKQVWAIQKLHGCAGVAIHPYTKTPAQALALVNAYKTIVGTSVPIWITEWNNAKPEVAYFKSIMQANAIPAACWYPWTEIMNNNLQGLNEHDDLRRALCA